MNSDLNYTKHLEQGRKTQKDYWNKIYEKYLENPKLCLQCNTIISYKKRLKYKFCSSSCSALYNNIKRVEDKICPSCNIKFKPKRYNRVYCSQKCSSINAGTVTANKSLDKLKNKIEKGLKIGYTSLKRFIKHRDGYKCSICSNPGEWEFKPLTMILDHIDGNSDNNDPDNLRLVCSNCDSQLPTFKGRNIGNGRYLRRKRYKEGKSY